MIITNYKGPQLEKKCCNFNGLSVLSTLRIRYTCMGSSRTMRRFVVLFSRQWARAINAAVSSYVTLHAKKGLRTYNYADSEALDQPGPIHSLTLSVCFSSQSVMWISQQTL